MALAGLRTTGLDGRPLTFRQAALKWLGSVLTVALVGLPLLLALGIFGQAIAIDRGRELVVAKLATWERALDETFAYEDVRMIDAIGRALAEDEGR